MLEYKEKIIYEINQFLYDKLEKIIIPKLNIEKPDSLNKRILQNMICYQSQFLFNFEQILKITDMYQIAQTQNEIKERSDNIIRSIEECTSKKTLDRLNQQLSTLKDTTNDEGYFFHVKKIMIMNDLNSLKTPKIKTIKLLYSIFNPTSPPKRSPEKENRLYLMKQKNV